jgi:hypothetical protein
VISRARPKGIRAGAPVSSARWKPGPAIALAGLLALAPWMANAAARYT